LRPVQMLRDRGQPRPGHLDTVSGGTRVALTDPGAPAGCSRSGSLVGRFIHPIDR